MGLFDDLLEEDELTQQPVQPQSKSRKGGLFDDLLEEDDIAPVTPQATQPAVTQPTAYKYDPTRFRPKGVSAPKAEQEIGTLEGIANAARNAFDSSRQALDIIGDVTPEEAKNIAKIEFDKQSRKIAPGYDEYQKAEGFDAVLAFAKNPIEVTSNIVAEGLAGSLPALGAGLAAGGVGAAAGSVVPVLGTAAGFTAGQVAGTFAGSLATEYGSKILEEMQEGGVDLTKPESIQGFFENEEAVAKARDKAISRGIPVAAFDAISAGIGGKLGRVIGKQFLTKTGEAAAELGVQAGLGGGGEVAGALAAGEPIEGKAVFAEVIGEAGPGAAEIITGRMADRAARVKAEEDAKIKAAAQLSENLEQNSAPLTAAVVKSTTATTIEQDKLAAQLDEQLDADEIEKQVSGQLAVTKEPTAAAQKPMSKDELKAIYSQVAPEELDAAEAGFTEQAVTDATEEGRISAQNALEAIKEVKATVTPPAPTVEPTIIPAVTPAVPTAQPPIIDATQEIIQPEGVRQKPQDGTQIQTEEAGVGGGVFDTTRGEEEGQVVPTPTAEEPLAVQPTEAVKPAITEQEKSLGEAQSRYDSEIATYKNQRRINLIDDQELGKKLKAAGMRFSAEKRKITGQLTSKEAEAEAKREASNYIGKLVEVDGKPGKVVGNPFGRVRVKLDEGGATITAAPDKVTALLAATPEPTISEIPPTSELVGEQPAEPIISEIPATSELVGAEPTQPTIREVPEIPPIVGEEPSAIVEQEPVAPAITEQEVDSEIAKTNREIASLESQRKAEALKDAPRKQVIYGFDDRIKESKERLKALNKQKDAFYYGKIQEQEVGLEDALQAEADKIAPRDATGPLSQAETITLNGLRLDEEMSGKLSRISQIAKDRLEARVAAPTPPAPTVAPAESAVEVAKRTDFTTAATREEAGEIGRNIASQDPNLPPPPPPQFEVLESISNSQSRKAYNPDVLTEEAINEARENGFITGKKVGKFRFTESGRNQLREWSDQARDRSLALDALRDEIGDIAVSQWDTANAPESAAAIAARTAPTPVTTPPVTEAVTPAAAPTPAAPAEPAAEVAPIQRDMTKPEQMTPKEWKASRKKAEGNAYSPAVSEYQQKGAANNAIKQLDPVSSASVDEYGIKLPKGYTKQGDLYVYQKAATVPTAVTAEPKKARFDSEYAKSVRPIVSAMLDQTNSSDVITKAAGRKLSKEQEIDVVIEWAKILSEKGELALPSDFNMLEIDQAYMVEPALSNLGLLEKPAAPIPSAVAEPAGISVGNRIKLGKSPQTYTIEEVIPQSATGRDLGEQYYSVKNERTGETQVVEARDLRQVKGKGARKIAAAAIDTTPENILITPPDQQYTFNEVFDVAYDMFGGEIPEGFTIVNDSKDKDFEFKAAYIPESGEIIVNLAYLNKSDDIRDTITHELGHYIFGDPEFRAAFDQFIASLSPEARADLDAYVETAYNKETGEIRLEEKMVRAFVDQFINEEQAPAWRSMLDAIKRFLNKLGFKFNISDRDAISVFTAALDRYKAGEAISREGGARKIIDDLTAMDAEYLAAVERGDMETAQRMVDEAAKKAGYNVGPVWHGSKSSGFNIFDIKKSGSTDNGWLGTGFYFSNRRDVASYYGGEGFGRLAEELKDTPWIKNAFGGGIMQALLKGNFITIEASAAPISKQRQLAEKLGVLEKAKGIDPNSKEMSDFLKKSVIDAGYNGVEYKIGITGDEKANVPGYSATEYVVYDNNQIKSADPVTYDDAGDAIPLSQRFRPTSPDIRRMAAEPRREQVAGMEREEARYITTPEGIIKQTNDVLREKFFDGTTVSPEKTTEAWGYISRLLDIKSGAANEFAGQINDVVDQDTNSEARMGASLFSVSLANYAAKLAAQGDSKMLKYMIRNVNSMPTDKYAGGKSDAGRALRSAKEYDIDGYGAIKIEVKAKVERTTATLFGTGSPTDAQVKAVEGAIKESDAQELGNPEEVAQEVEKVEKRTKRKITDKIEKIIGKGSLKGIIQAIKETPLEKQQEAGWIEKVVNDFLVNAGLSPEVAATASKLYESLIAERLAEARQKAFEDNLNKSAPWKDYLSRNSRLAKDSLKKIKEAIRTGALDPEQNVESIIAAESGWSGFTKDQYQKIVQLDNIINDPKQDDVTRREAMADLNKVISNAKLPVRFKDALGAYYVGNALMGIPTLTVNIASPIGFTIRNLMTDVGKFAFTDPARIPVAFETFMESMRSWYDQTSYAFKNQIYLNDVVEYLQGQNVLRKLFDKGKKQWAEGKYAEGFVNMAVGMTQITGRVLSSLDQGAISMLENQNITRYALEALANTKGKVPKDKLKEFANMVIDTRRKTIAQSIANGMSRDRAGVLADLAVKSEVISALSQYDINPMNVLDASINDALQSVGRNKTLTIKGVEQSQQKISDSGFLSYLPIKMLENVAEASGREGSAMQIFAKMLYGFALVPARVFHNVAWFSPYGFIRLGIDKYKKNKGEDSPYAMSLQTEAQYRQRLTDSIAGSIAMLGLAALSSASTDEDEDKKFKIVITGNGPSATTDKQYFDSWMKKWKPYSVHIVVNGNIIPINIGRGGEALFFPIMLAGALDDWKIKQKQNLTKKEPEDLSAIAQMLGSSFFALAQRGPYAAFTKPLFDASKDGRVTEELASQAGFFGKTFIPVIGSSLSRNISDLFNDPVDRSSIEGAIYANTPVVGPWLGTKALNALGQPIRADDWGDKLYKLGVPVVFSFPKETPMNELNELILKQGSGPTIPTRANAQKRFGDVLTDKEFEAYVREYGKVMSDKMFKSRTKLANMKPADYDDELEKYARGYSIDGIKIKGASDSAVLAVKRMRQ